MTQLKRSIPMKAATSISQYDFVQASTGATISTVTGSVPFGMSTLDVDNSTGVYDDLKTTVIRQGPGRCIAIVEDQTIATGGLFSSNIAVGDALQLMVHGGVTYVAAEVGATSPTIAYAVSTVTGDTSGDTTDLIEVDFCMNQNPRV